MGWNLKWIAMPLWVCHYKDRQSRDNRDDVMASGYQATMWLTVTVATSPLTNVLYTAFLLLMPFIFVTLFANNPTFYLDWVN